MDLREVGMLPIPTRGSDVIKSVLLRLLALYFFTAEAVKLTHGDHATATRGRGKSVLLSSM